MKRPRHWLSAAGMALLVVGHPGLAADLQVEPPDFTLQVRLDEGARRYLLARQETVAVSVAMADFIGPGGVTLGSLLHEAKDSFSVHAKDAKFDLAKAKRLGATDYEVLVNVYSGRRKLDMNVLDCDLLQAQISQLQRRVHKIECRLGTWAPR